MAERRVIVLTGPEARDQASAAVRAAEIGHVVEVRPARRNSDQNRKFHAICRDIAASGIEWSGKARTEEEWKFLLVSGHAVATKRPGEFGLGLEQERLMLRPSTAAMSVAEMTSLIEYATAWAVQHGIKLREPEL